MKKEIIFSLIILIFIIILDIILTKEIDNKIDAISNDSEILEEKIKDENTEEIIDQYDALEKEWKKTEEAFSFYLEHDELEKVGTEMTNIKSGIDTLEWNETISNIERMKFILEHLKDKMDLKLKNIF